MEKVSRTLFSILCLLYYPSVLTILSHCIDHLFWKKRSELVVREKEKESTSREEEMLSQLRQMNRLLATAPQVMPRYYASSKYVIDATDDNFQQVLEKSHTTPLIVDFYADWCGYVFHPYFLC